MKKMLFIGVVVFATIALVGCSDSEKFEVRSYHRDYIEFNNGRFWLNYSIMQEKLDSGEVKDSFLLLKSRNNDSGEYAPIHRIPQKYYQIGDYILGNEDYVFLFSFSENKENAIVRYSTKRFNSKIVKPTFSEKIINVEPLGIKDEYIFIKYELNKYAKIDFSLKHIEILNKKSEVPDDLEYIPIR